MALLSGEMMVEQRAAVIERFREGKEKVLVTTNVCARGNGDAQRLSLFQSGKASLAASAGPGGQPWSPFHWPRYSFEASKDLAKSCACPEGRESPF